MSNSNLSFKYLEAGAKSSPVVHDPSLLTGNEQTIYLYHQQRDRITEYRRDIVESKLRELSAEESQQEASLQQAYEKARAEFTPRGTPPVLEQPVPAKAASQVPPPDEEEEDEEFDFVDDDALEMDD